MIRRSNESTTPLGVSGVLTGQSHNLKGAKTPDKFTAFALASHASVANGLKIQLSNDGITWFTVAQMSLVANIPAILEVAAFADFARVTLTNDIVPQTSLFLNTSY